MFGQVAPEDTREIYADKIYDTLSVKAWMRERCITNRILKKGSPAYQIEGAKDHERNHKKGLLGAPGISSGFSVILKQWQGYPKGALFGTGKKPIGVDAQSRRLQFEKAGKNNQNLKPGLKSRLHGRQGDGQKPELKKAKNHRLRFQNRNAHLLFKSPLLQRFPFGIRAAERGHLSRYIPGRRRGNSERSRRD